MYDIMILSHWGLPLGFKKLQETAYLSMMMGFEHAKNENNTLTFRGKN
jgi:hypothetical protein